MSPPAKLRVLLIDDDDVYRSILRVLLEDEGYTVMEASSLAESREVLSRRPGLDVVLLDAALPDGSGPSLAPELRAALPGVKLVLLSGSGEPGSAGFDEVDARVLKGGDPEELLGLLQTFGAG